MAAENPIPDRPLFKAADVCTIAGVQPYILRSWEAEFSFLAKLKKKGGTRVYRRSDVKIVLEIKKLVFGEGLTLGAARRKLEAEKESPAVKNDETWPVGIFDPGAFEKIADVKQGLRDILGMLSANGIRLANVEAVPSKQVKRPAAKSRKKRPALGRGLSALIPDRSVKGKGKKLAKRKQLV